MFKKPFYIIVLSIYFIPVIGQAQDSGEALATARMCYACHQMDAASLGPPWRAIAARHAPRRDVMVDVLAGKIIRGGGGNWGQVPMVPNQRVSDAEARTMAEWILGLADNAANQ